MNIYGLLIGVGVVIGIELIRRYYKGLSYLDILFLLFFTLIGARLLFVLHNIEEVRLGLINPLAIWDGGLAFYGGVIGLLISLWIVSRYKKIKFVRLSDTVLLFLPLIHAIGRIGNFFNYELYGKPTSLPWGISIPQQYRDIEYINYSHFHPVFFYESILNILNFSLLLYLSKKYKKDGLVTAIYLIAYSITRLLMNTLRIDKEYFLNFETSDILSVIFLLSGILILIATMNNKKFKEKIARIFSKEVTICLILVSVLSVLLNSKASLPLNIFLGFFTFLIPILAIILFKTLGITSDYNVTKREERPKLFLVIGLCFLTCLITSLTSSHQLLMVIYSTLNISFFLGLLITLFWKISFHMIWSTLSIFFIIFSWNIPSLYLLIFLLPLIGWSRVYQKKHTTPQVLVGFLTTVICILFVLTLMKFW